MSKNNTIVKDERTISVENASYGLGYKIVVYALLLDVIYRSLKVGDASWDLMGIVIFSGMIVTAYQMKYKIFAKGWVKIVVLTSSVAMAIAIIMVTALMNR